MVLVNKKPRYVTAWQDSLVVLVLPTFYEKRVTFHNYIRNNLSNFLKLWCIVLIKVKVFQANLKVILDQCNHFHQSTKQSR